MSTQIETKIALVTGANKGIGYEIARQIGKTRAIMLLGARNADAGRPPPALSSRTASRPPGYRWT